jgi:hypothetical protein
VGAVASDVLLVDLQGILLDQRQSIAEVFLYFSEGREAAAIPFDRYDRCSRIEKRTRQSSWTWADLVDALAVQIAGYRRNAREQLAIEDEVLA